MSKIVWDKSGEHFFETGVDHGVLYPITPDGKYTEGHAWNGLTAITVSPSGAEASPHYADNIKYLNLVSAEEIGGSIEAFYYPDAFGECNGEKSPVQGVSIGQQARKTFGLSWRSLLGNEIVGAEYGYKLHLLYGALAAPSEKAYNTINESVEPSTMSWEYTTTPVAVPGFKPTAYITVDSTKIDKSKLLALETILYGDDSAEPRLPLPEEVLTILGATIVEGE